MSSQFYRMINEIDAALNDPSPSAERMGVILDTLNTEALRAHFFAHVTSLAWFRLLKERGTFASIHNPQVLTLEEEHTYQLSPWPALEYLEKVSKECDKPENSEYASELMQIIRHVTKPPTGKRTDNPRTWWYFAKITANLPSSVINMADIELVADWLDSCFGTGRIGIELGNSLLPKLLQSPAVDDWKKAAKLVEIATRISWVEREYPSGRVDQEPRTAVDSYSLKGLFAKNASLLGEKCGKEVVETLSARLAEEWGTALGDPYSYIWRTAIEDHRYNRGEDRAKDVLVSALRDVLLAYGKAKPEGAEEILRDLLAEGPFVVRRIALYVVNEQFDVQKEIFWNAFEPGLFCTDLHHELFELLKRHFRDFSPDEQTRIVETIEKLTVNLPEKEERDLHDANLRLNWLQAIRGQGNPRVDKLYGEYLAVGKYASDHPEFVSYIETRSGETKPLPLEEFLTYSVSQIAEYINEFKESGEWEGPTEEGLAELLGDAVKQEPEKFENELEAFLKTKPLYLYSILSAFRELWNSKRPINWTQLLDFCLSIVTPDGFWSQTEETQESDTQPTRAGVISAICGLIEAGVKDDAWAFEETLLPVAERIILRILEKQPATAKGKEEDALGEAMNTTKGRCLMALVNYSLRQARLSDKRENNHEVFWDRIQPVFDRELGQCRGINFEFSALAGRFLPNLFYLSKEWVRTNTDLIFSLSHEANWHCAVQGYAYVSTFYRDIYTLLKEHGHLKKALDTDFKNKYVREMLVQEVSVAYLRGLEDLTGDNSLLAELVRGWKADDVTEIISFFWSQRDTKLEDQARDRILEFWKACFQKIEGHEKDNVAILSDLNLLAAFLTEISPEQKNWLLQSAPYVEENYHGQFFIEYLRKLVSQNPEAVAEICVRMLSRAIPRFKEEDIRAVVEKLYQENLKEEAVEICSKYAENAALNGYPDFLKDLYDRYDS